MSETPGGRELTLPSLLATRARTASDGRLALDTAVGLIAGSLAIALRPPAWPVLASAAICLVSFGAWGIADRGVNDANAGGRGLRVLRGLRACAAALGVVGAVALVATAMALMLGTWIS
ncbi:MAG: hypothetical protein ACT4PJ_06835 [Gemmatimonadaceae bacterium]